MKAIVLAAALSLCGTLALAQPIQYQSSDNINNTPVSAATPLPVTVANQTGTSASQVQGTSANGSAFVGNPLWVGGYDGTNVQAFRTLPGLGSNGVGLLATGMTAIYNSTLPSYSNGNYGALQMSANGALNIEGSSASSAADDGSKPLKIGCVVAASGFPETGTLSQRINQYCSPSGALGIAVQGASGGLSNVVVSSVALNSSTSTSISVEEAGRSFSNITTNATTTVKSGAGYLHTLCINTKGATANTATIYDNTAGSGTKIGTLDTTAGVGCQTYDVRFGTGLTIVTATGTAPDITVSYR